MSIKLFRSTLLGLSAMQAAWFFAPWEYAYGSATGVLSWVGANAWFPTQVAILLSSSFTLLLLVSYIAMALFIDWGRWLLLAITLAGGAVIPLYGLSIQSGIEGALGFFCSVGDGFVLGMAFFSKEVVDRFRETPSMP